MVRTVSVAPFLDLNADTLGATGTAVTSWADTSNGRTFSQATATRQPSVVAAPNGHKGVQFNGHFLASNAVTAASTSAITVMLVMRSDAAASVARAGILTGVSASNTNDYDTGWYVTTPNSTSETTFTSLVVGGLPIGSDPRIKTSSQAYGTWTIITAVLGNNAPQQGYTNGTAETAANVPATARSQLFRPEQLYLGCRWYSNATDFSRVSLARVLVYPGRLSAADRAAAHSNLSDAYGITVADYVAEGPPKATGSGTWATTGAATGKRSPSANSSGAWSTIGAAAGRRFPTASAAGAWAFTGQATAQRVAKATAAGQSAWAGQAQGLRSPKATATGATAWAGTATGYAAPVAPANGTAAGAWTTAGAATGRRTPQATALGALTWTGAAVGYTPSGAPPDHLPGAATLTSSVGDAVLLFSPGLAALAPQPAAAALITAVGTATIDLT